MSTVYVQVSLSALLTRARETTLEKTIKRLVKTKTGRDMPHTEPVLLREFFVLGSLPA